MITLRPLARLHLNVYRSRQSNHSLFTWGTRPSLSNKVDPFDITSPRDPPMHSTSLSLSRRRGPQAEKQRSAVYTETISNTALEVALACTIDACCGKSCEWSDYIARDRPFDTEQKEVVSKLINLTAKMITEGPLSVDIASILMAGGNREQRVRIPKQPYFAEDRYWWRTAWAFPGWSPFEFHEAEVVQYPDECPVCLSKVVCPHDGRDEPQAMVVHWITNCVPTLEIFDALKLDLLLAQPTFAVRGLELALIRKRRAEQSDDACKTLDSIAAPFTGLPTPPSFSNLLDEDLLARTPCSVQCPMSDCGSWFHNQRSLWTHLLESCCTHPMYAILHADAIRCAIGPSYWDRFVIKMLKEAGRYRGPVHHVDSATNVP